MEKSGLHDLPPPEGDSPAHQDEENRGEGNDPQSADLEKEDGDDLAGKRKVFGDIDRGQAGYANGRIGGEKGIDKGQVTLCRRKRKPEKKGPQKDHGGKTEDEDPGRGKEAGSKRFKAEALFFRHRWLPFFRRRNKPILSECAV